jgi:hypothetical protein
MLRQQAGLRLHLHRRRRFGGPSKGEGAKADQTDPGLESKTTLGPNRPSVG